MKDNISDFINCWKNKGDEKQDTQSFWIDLMERVFDVNNAPEFFQFEKKVRMDVGINGSRESKIGFIDAFISRIDHSVLIEQKSAGVDLSKKEKQCDGTWLTPYEQARRYARFLPHNENPRYIIVCNFLEFRIYDMSEELPSENKYVGFLLKDLGSRFSLLDFLKDPEYIRLVQEKELSVKAGQLVAQIYDALNNQYKLAADYEENKRYYSRCLNKLCVRLIFCLFAEDAKLFGVKGDEFSHFIGFDSSGKKRSPDDCNMRLQALFRIFDVPLAKRTQFEMGNEFPYINGGLFHDEKESCSIPPFTNEIVELICISAGSFDWSKISPTIFGAVFESTLNPETRRSGGMHYTSIENIHRLIDPLFLSDLRKEWMGIKNKITLNGKSGRCLSQADLQLCLNFQIKLSSLHFFDPACGSGNFLTETYLSLRRLENEVIMTMYDKRMFLTQDSNVIRVSINQFSGIEINDFAVSVAKTALWIAEAQTQLETQTIVNQNIDYFPLTTNKNIVEGSALTVDWKKYVSFNDNEYIIGNPPFVGARLMKPEQKEELSGVFGDDWQGKGDLDYVAAWYKKAAETIQGTKIRCAFVSTSSICEGESIGNLWFGLFSKYGIRFSFVWKRFVWDSEATQGAHVHVVILGFQCFDEKKGKFIYSIDPTSKKISKTEAKNINPYLLNFSDFFVLSRNEPLFQVPKIGIGCKPIDNGKYLFTKTEMIDFLEREPKAAQYFHKWFGADEFINGTERYCLWLGDCEPHDLMNMPNCLKRVEEVKEFRLKSRNAETRKLADTPRRFHVENIPQASYLLIPRVSSKNRRYIPIGYLPSGTIPSDSCHVIQNASLYLFGVLTSSVHMIWMKTVCGRLKSDYRYSKQLVYNNFPWKKATAKQIEEIEESAKNILLTREKYGNSSLADLYNEFAMPVDLLKAHQLNDRLVLSLYGLSTTSSEEEILERLCELYKKAL